jgi:hypothetical protein
MWRVLYRFILKSVIYQNSSAELKSVKQILATSKQCKSSNKRSVKLDLEIMIY